LIDHVIAVIINTIAYLNLTVGDAEIAVTCVTDLIAISIFLRSIEHFRTVITSIADAVLILIELVRIRDIRTIVFEPTELICISVYTRPSQRSLKRQDREMMARELRVTLWCATVSISPSTILLILPSEQGVCEIEVMTWALLWVA
jgi:hypothetical protein